MRGSWYLQMARIYALIIRAWWAITPLRWVCTATVFKKMRSPFFYIWVNYLQTSKPKIQSPEAS